MAFTHLFYSLCGIYSRPILLTSLTVSGGIIGHCYGLNTAIKENQEETEYASCASVGTILGAGVGAMLYFALPTISIVSLLAIPAVGVAKFRRTTIKNE